MDEDWHAVCQVKASTEFGRPVRWPEIRLRNPHASHQERVNVLRRQCHHEFWWLSQGEHRASYSPETRHCDPPRRRSSCACVDPRTTTPQCLSLQVLAHDEKAAVGKRFQKTSTASVDCNWTAWMSWEEESEERGVWKGSAAVSSEMSWREFVGKVLVCMAVRRARFGNRRVACAVFNLERSSDRSRTMNVEKLRVREPVNNGRRNKRTFSREQLATVLDANAQEALLLRHQTASWPSAEELKPMSRSTFLHSFEGKITASTPSPSASPTVVRSARSGTRCWSAQMREFLGTVSTEYTVLDPMYWRHWDDVVCKSLPTDHGKEHRVHALLRNLDEGSLFTSLTSKPHTASIGTGAIGV